MLYPLTKSPMMNSVYAFAVFMILLACSGENRAMNNNQPLIETLIIGSAESPDPVLERVQELEREGKVKDVVVMESFPVQIHLKAPKEIINELNRIPRVEGGLR